MTEFVKPSIEYFELWPLLVVFGVACLGVVVEAFLPRSVRYTAQVVLALGGLVLALVLFGFFPMPLLDVINPVVHDTLAGVGIGQEGGHQ